MNTTMLNKPNFQISDLITDLGSEDGLVRQRARLMLVHLGQDSLLALFEALESANTQIRWEAVRALGELREPETITALTEMLTDEDTGVRWVAMEGLIGMGRYCLKPLLMRFIREFDSPLLREGVHHILHVLKDRNALNEAETTLFEKLDKQAVLGLELSWTSDQVWAAEKALEALDEEAK